MLIVCVALDAGLLAGWLIIANIRDVFNHLFSLGVQHFHEESLCGCTSSTMLQIKVIFSAGSHYMNFRNNTYQFCEFFLNSYKLGRQATHDSNRVEESKEKEKERKKWKNNLICQLVTHNIDCACLLKTILIGSESHCANANNRNNRMHQMRMEPIEIID